MRNAWCSGAVKVDGQGSPHVSSKFLMLSCQPFYLPRKLIGVYIVNLPSDENFKNAGQELYDIISRNMPLICNSWNELNLFLRHKKKQKNKQKKPFRIALTFVTVASFPASSHTTMVLANEYKMRCFKTEEKDYFIWNDHIIIKKRKMFIFHFFIRRLEDTFNRALTELQKLAQKHLTHSWCKK